MKRILFYGIVFISTISYTMEQHFHIPPLRELCLRKICQILPADLIEEIAAFKRKNLQEEPFLVAQEKERALKDLLLRKWQLHLKFQQMGCDHFGYPLD